MYAFFRFFEWSFGLLGTPTFVNFDYNLGQLWQIYAQQLKFNLTLGSIINITTHYVSDKFSLSNTSNVSKKMSVAII